MSAICGIGSIGEYPGIGIGGNFGIGAALVHMHSYTHVHMDTRGCT